MGIFSKLFGRASDRGDTESPGVSVSFSIGIEVAPLTKVAGTTTFAAEASRQLAKHLLADSDGYLEASARLAHEQADERRPDAIDVWFEGLRIGSLPAYVTQRLALPLGEPVQAPAQFCAANTPNGPRLDAWVWLGNGTASWDYSRQNRPRVTTEGRAKEAHASTRKMLSDGIAQGGTRLEDLWSGQVEGVHHLETVEPVKQLKREGRLEEALVLCYLGIEGAERDRKGREPAPWYTLQAAIIHRKLKQREQEIAVLKRWLDACPPNRREDSQIHERWAKLTGLRG